MFHMLITPQMILYTENLDLGFGYRKSLFSSYLARVGLPDNILEVVCVHSASPTAANTTGFIDLIDVRERWVKASAQQAEGML